MATDVVIHRRITAEEKRNLLRRMRAVQEAQDALEELVLATNDGNPTYTLDVNRGIITKPKPPEPKHVNVAELSELS